MVTRYFPPSVTTLTSPQAVSLVQESWGLSQGQPQQRTLAHSLPQHRGDGGEEEGGETSLARSKVEIWWSSGLRLASGRLVGRPGWDELNRLAQVGALTPLTCYLVRTLFFRLQYNPQTRFRETLLLAKKRQNQSVHCHFEVASRQFGEEGSFKWSAVSAFIARCLHLHDKVGWQMFFILWDCVSNKGKDFAIFFYWKTWLKIYYCGRLYTAEYKQDKYSCNLNLVEAFPVLADNNWVCNASGWNIVCAIDA